MANGKYGVYYFKVRGQIDSKDKIQWLPEKKCLVCEGLIIMDDKNETRTAKAINYIKENGSVSLDDLCILLRRGKNNVRALLSKYVASKTLYVNNIDGLNSMYSDVPFEDAEDVELSDPTEEVPKKDSTKLPKDIFLAPKEPTEEVPKDSEDIILPPKDKTDEVFVEIKGLGTVSKEKLSEWFAEGILTVDIDKLVAKMKTSTLVIEKDKIIFGV